MPEYTGGSRRLPRGLTSERFTVYELSAEYDGNSLPSLSPHATQIATVAAGSIEEAHEIALEQYGAPLAIE